jgi:hypothetical protein
MENNDRLIGYVRQSVRFRYKHTYSTTQEMVEDIVHDIYMTGGDTTYLIAQQYGYEKLPEKVLEVVNSLT